MDTPAQTVIDPSSVRLFYEPAGMLRMTVGDERSYHTVKLFQAWPMSVPGRYLSFQDGKGEEIVMVEGLGELPEASRPVAEEELRRRYLTSRIEAINNIRTEFGVTYWNVLTNRGERDFVVQSLTESCVWLSDTHILVIDVDGNRFEIPDMDALDSTSRTRLNWVL